MKKIFEFDVKSKEDIPYNSPTFEQLKKEIIESIKERWGDSFNKTAFQCNCIKIKEKDENSEYTILVKVYAWPKIDKVEEINFFINAEESELKTVSNSEMQKQLDGYIDELKDLQAALVIIENRIDENLGKYLEDKSVLVNLTQDTEKMKELKNKIDKVSKKITYLKSEFEL